MIDEVEPLDETPAAGPRLYLLLCLTALMIAALPLLARGLGLWAFFPLGVGAGALFLRWRVGPFLVLLSVLALIVAERNQMTPLELLTNVLIMLSRPFVRLRRPLPSFTTQNWRLQEANAMLDLVFGSAMLAYLIGVFRYLGVTLNILPIDRRNRTPKEPTTPGTPPPPEPRRSPHLIRGSETVIVLALACALSLLCVLLWEWLQERKARYDLITLSELSQSQLGMRMEVSDESWQLLLLLWGVGLGLIAVTGVLAYLGQLRMTKDEAGLYLQDELWRQTRREQSRINRWLAWARKKFGKVV